MKKLNRRRFIRRRKIEGVPESEVAAVESRLNIKFPRAYREYLYLAGKYAGGLNLYEGHCSLDMLSHPENLKALAEALEQNKLVIERPFWVISEMDSYEQFSFFYLDDENSKNPSVYGVTYDGYDNTYIYPFNKSLTKYIDEIIEESLLIAKRDW